VDGAGIMAGDTGTMVITEVVVDTMAGTTIMVGIATAAGTTEVVGIMAQDTKTKILIQSRSA